VPVSTPSSKASVRCNSQRVTAAVISNTTPWTAIGDAGKWFPPILAAVNGSRAT